MVGLLKANTSIDRDPCQHHLRLRLHSSKAIWIDWPFSKDSSQAGDAGRSGQSASFHTTCSFDEGGASIVPVPRPRTFLQDWKCKSKSSLQQFNKCFLFHLMPR